LLDKKFILKTFFFLKIKGKRFTHKTKKMGNAAYDSIPTAEHEKIPHPDRYIDGLEKFHKTCVTCDDNFENRTKSMIKKKYGVPAKKEADDAWEDIKPHVPKDNAVNFKEENLKKVVRHKFKEEKLFHFIQDAYAQDMFNFFVADILRTKPFEIARKKVKRSKEIRPLWNGDKIVLESIDFAEVKFQKFVKDVNENRTFPEISGQITAVPIKNALDWTRAMSNLRALLKQTQNVVNANVQKEATFK
jgi:hypothetical protein